ncbi:proline-rich receptor-like protein kinase PERK8 [Centruroides sculpturatus]|uniref:proline-rich receptor-like protein kinase PERK8 n=1 Tax=Centruroides sculpturatus TaxID=218467 RepID=UPI000C6CDD61|nr:proline-rich receptor-like protein kinase PERK8 [Centruroides sculpturatus]
MTELTVLVPLHPPHGCQLCLPIPHNYADHAGLVKHLKHIHGTTLQFECNACGYTHDKLKVIKAHQLKANDCRVRIEACSPPPPLPADLKKVCIPTKPRKPYARIAPKTAPTPSPSSDESWNSAPPSPPTEHAATQTRRTTRSLQIVIKENHSLQAEHTPSAPATPPPGIQGPSQDTTSVQVQPTPNGRRRRQRQRTSARPQPNGEQQLPNMPTQDAMQQPTVSTTPPGRPITSTSPSNSCTLSSPYRRNVTPSPASPAPSPTQHQGEPTGELHQDPLSTQPQQAPDAPTPDDGPPSGLRRGHHNLRQHKTRTCWRVSLLTSSNWPTKSATSKARGSPTGTLPITHRPVK